MKRMSLVRIPPPPSCVDMSKKKNISHNFDVIVLTVGTVTLRLLCQEALIKTKYNKLKIWPCLKASWY
jgi:hypothetical protein